MSKEGSCLTREDLVDWLKEKKCEQKPIEGINVTARQIKFYNPATNRSTYIGTPINDIPVPDYVVFQVCTTLGIEIPACVSHTESTYNQIRDTFKNK